MKILTFVIALLCISTLSAETLEVPRGDYQYVSSKVSFVKDIQVLNTKNRAGQNRLHKFKQNKYTCSRHPNSWYKCQKYLTNRTIVKVPLNEILALTPNFEEDFMVDMVSESDYLSIFEVEQVVTTPKSRAFNYRLYVMKSGEKHLDVKLDNTTYRFNYDSTNKLSLQLIKRKAVKRNNWLEYGVLSNFLRN